MVPNSRTSTSSLRTLSSLERSLPKLASNHHQHHDQSDEMEEASKPPLDVESPEPSETTPGRRRRRGRSDVWPVLQQQSDGGGGDAATAQAQKKKDAATTTSRWSKVKDIGLAQLTYVGLGMMGCCAYFDPGNWVTDLAAGAQFQYKLLFVVLLAGLFGIVLQVLTTRLGMVTGLDLAQWSRIILNDRPKHPRFWRYCALWPLYIFAEMAIYLTDIAELLGVAIAIKLLIPEIPFPATIAMTSIDTLFVWLANRNRTGANALALFEYGIAVLVIVVFISMIILVGRISPPAGDVFFGFVPSPTVVKPEALVIAIGILGATIMPHGLYLGSNQAASAHFKKYRVNNLEPPHPLEEDERLLSRLGTAKASYAEVKRDLPHCSWDVALSLVFFAIPINSAILIVAGKSFFGEASDVADLFDAYYLVQEYVSKPAGTVFAIALLASGQSSSIAAALSGQAVSVGFLKRHINPVLRRLVTRTLAIVPCVVCAAVGGRPLVNQLIVISQVGLSLILPFVSAPLLMAVCSKEVMKIWDTQKQEWRYYNCGWFTGTVAWLIWGVVVLADVYTLATGF